MIIFFAAGYPTLLSATLENLGLIPDNYQDAYFASDKEVDEPWTEADTVKRYPLSLPFYPFRTLSPRELYLRKQTASEYDIASPLFPANTQINFTLKRRKGNVLNFMLPLKLDSLIGSRRALVTEAEKNAATSFSVTTGGGDGANPVVRQYNIKNVSIILKDITMQVKNFFISFLLIICINLYICIYIYWYFCTPSFLYY
jgi:hypothetical protein